MKILSDRINYYITAALIILLLFAITPAGTAKAGTASAVSLGTVNYEELTLQVFSNQNSIVFYSLDQLSWTEVEGSYEAGTYLMDISWVSSSAEVTIYFKGDSNTSVTSITLPMQNNDFKAAFDKVEGVFTFDNTDLADSFEWRKATDYNWSTVSLYETSPSHQAFLEKIESFRVKGAKIVLRLPQETGNAIDSGCRPSKEISITIPARASAPNITVNTSSLTLNTTTAMEYYDEATGIWMECAKGMTVEEIAPEALYQNGSKDVILKLRTAATEKAPYSKTAQLTIPGQQAAPKIGGNTDDLSYYYVNSKLTMVFNLASTINQYEYVVVKPYVDFDIAKAKWTTVSHSRPMTLTNTTAPNGSTIYVRKKGIAANATKKISLSLPTAIASFDVIIR